jgi:hypothetical protein
VNENGIHFEREENVMVQRLESVKSLEKKSPEFQSPFLIIIECEFSGDCLLVGVGPTIFVPPLVYMFSYFQTALIFSQVLLGLGPY